MGGSKTSALFVASECPLPEQMKICDNPDTAAEYWRLNVATNPYYNPHCECMVVLLLNTRKRV